MGSGEKYGLSSKLLPSVGDMELGVVMPEARIHILEGIPGAGKNVAAEIICRQYDSDASPVFRFDEELLLFSWRHNHVPGIEHARLKFMNTMLDYARTELNGNPETVFVFTRFHISFLLLGKTGTLGRPYSQILNKLRRLPVLITVPILRRPEITQRASHIERTDAAWRLYLQRRLAETGSTSLEELFAAQQEQIIELVVKQGLPYRFVRVVDHELATESISAHADSGSKRPA